MQQTIKGNMAFIKRTVLPMTKKAGIKKVKIKTLTPQLPDDKPGMELTFDTDKEKNAKLLALLKSKIGKKGTVKRKKMNLTISKEQIKEIIREEIQTLTEYKKEFTNKFGEFKIGKKGKWFVLYKNGTDVGHHPTGKSAEWAANNWDKF
jgi:hypothetical protein|tara:strand:- start:1131 stop:1577 length:447 start_codon:yes stop_codon:yes gene_type:complete